jgi:outer membrane lipoprotein-sorting protein
MNQCICWTGTLVIACSTATLSNVAAQPPSAEGLLKDLIAKYRSAITYSEDCTFTDGGTSPHSQTWRGSFKLCFARPSSLRFDCHWNIAVIPVHAVWWSSEDGNSVWSSRSKCIDTLAADDLYRTRWPVGKSAYFIPALLNQRFADQHFPYVEALPPMTMVPDEAVEDTDCYHLMLMNGAATPSKSFDLWVGKGDLFVRKFAYRDGPTRHEEVHRHIQLDAELPADAFRVAPPE